MSDLKSLDQLGPITNEMLGGLHADEAMRLKIKRAAAEGKMTVRKPKVRFVPAVCCAALALCCVGVWSATRPATDKPGMVNEPMMVSTIAAGDGAADPTEQNLGFAFSEFQHHVASETVGHEYVHGALQQVTALDVAVKVDSRRCCQQRMGGQHEFVALFGFLPD